MLNFGRMNLITLHMEITGETDGTFLHRVQCEGKPGSFSFNPGNQMLDIPPDGEINQLLLRNHFQLLKILKTKNHKSFYPGFTLKFVISDGKDVSAFYNMDSIIKIDRRRSEDKIMVSDSGKENIHQVFTDASFMEQSGNSGIAAIIKSPDEKYQLYAVTSKATGNCEAELEAVAAGLEKLKAVKEIRIISDSRYVRKGLTEWMFNWRLNNWKTSNGNTAKNVETWKKIDQLIQKKYIEVAWVKGHSGHFENTLCDLYAREAAENS